MIFTKRGQVVLFSLSIVLFLFMLVLTFFAESLITSPIVSDNRVKILDSEAVRISDSLLLPGIPYNWNSSNVQKIGLASGDVLNLSKINNLDSMNYDASKIFLGVQFDYFINISYINDSNSQNTILINNTNLNNIIGDDGKDFVVTKQRSSLVKVGNLTFPASILVMSYSN